MRTARMVRTILLLVLISACSLLPAGCGKGKKPAEEKALTLLCGSSFVKPAEQLCQQFTAQTGIEVVTTVGGSEDFLPLVKAGQKGDILITHDPYLEYVAQAGALMDSVQVGFVAPVLAVQKGNPQGISSIEDIARPGLKVALSDPQYSTCGQMVFHLLEKKGIKDAVMKNVENRLTKGQSNLGIFLKTKVVDAVIMWNGVARSFQDSLDIVPTAYEYDEQIGVHIIGLSYSRQPDWVRQFLQFAQSRGPAVFTEHGYVK